MTPKKPGAIARRRRKCSVCRRAPAAMTGVGFCFGCWPGGPVTVRRLADLFGLSIQAGTRYTNVISHPHLSGNDQS
ncbi:hypothetical protein [Micromonospora sp. NPDC023888]|uniref:hypothetical protein n=1 Tax=Micromonospora sp. NPDC023888 TaxID=3155607 RepID=UPI0033E62CEE